MTAAVERATCLLKILVDESGGKPPPNPSVTVPNLNHGCTD